jgi:hypothetical protein
MTPNVKLQGPTTSEAQRRWLSVPCKRRFGVTFMSLDLGTMLTA